MGIPRRLVLKTVSVAVGTGLAGCAGDDGMRVTASSVTAGEGSCSGESRATVSVVDDRTRIEIEGVVPAETPCDPLDISVLTTRDAESRGRVIAEIDSRNEPTTDCDTCEETAYVPYTASVDTSEPITAIRVLHLWGTDESEIAVSRTVE
jgi:hypothetical protein